MKKVTKINENTSDFTERPKLRVAAYCRVSTDTAAEAERIRRAEKLGRVREPKAKKEVVYPTAFRISEGTERFDDPFQQAEYAYSLIETEVNVDGGQ